MYLNEFYKFHVNQWQAGPDHLRKKRCADWRGVTELSLNAHLDFTFF